MRAIWHHLAGKCHWAAEGHYSPAEGVLVGWEGLEGVFVAHRLQWDAEGAFLQIHSPYIFNADLHPHFHPRCSIPPPKLLPLHSSIHSLLPLPCSIHPLMHPLQCISHPLPLSNAPFPPYPLQCTIHPLPPLMLNSPHVTPSPMLHSPI